MKFPISLTLMLLANVVFAAAPTTNNLIAKTTISLNSSQFDTSVLPVTITNIDGSIISGNFPQNLVTNGSSISNVWIRELIHFGTVNAAIPTSGSFLNPGHTSAPQTSVLNGVSPSPEIGGYLTNLVIMSSVSWPDTTNIVVTVQTNSGITLPVDTPMTVTLNPFVGGAVYTNTPTGAAGFVNLIAGRGYVFTVKLVTTSPGGALAAQSLTGTIEWWHQSP